ncbi:kinase-like protein [Mytilinidion resinicola]|uniref:Kinase-like protein n=1 Tax=Mytilinidion resinicola TaxID=574789 RepID=A0A6A6YK69_9PEZI|nr:kinase-like protein [Mytilinidion resinicola]KAF2808933.1 kinase-like protein [Mytilinidion resinicola]
MVQHEGVEWFENGIHGLQPRWKKDPDSKTIESLARKHLGGNPQIQFLAQGGFNKLYRANSDKGPFVMRVALPVDPHYKTLSEVATMKFVREEAQIPVPNIFAFDASSDNDLDYEWILIELVPGQPLRKTWRKLPWDTKEKIVKQLARYHASLFRRRFDGIGNIYSSFMRVVAPIGGLRTQSESREQNRSPSVSTSRFPLSRAFYSLYSSGVDIVKRLRRRLAVFGGHLLRVLRGIGARLNLSTHSPALPATADMTNESNSVQESQNDPPKFTLGRIVSLGFFWGDRLSQDVSRGPFQNSYEWLSSRLSLMLADQQQILDTSKDEDDIEDAETSSQAIKKILKLLPTAFPPDEHESSFLFHDDLSMQNMMVDEAGKITAVIDWECVSALPLWRACQLPYLLEGKRRDEEPNRDEYGPDSDEEFPDGAEEDGPDKEGKTIIYWEHLLDYELTKLRKVYLEEMAKLEPQ